MSLKSTRITIKIEGGEEWALGTGSAIASFPSEQPVYTNTITLSDGTGAAHAQKFGLAGFSLTGGASVTFDLTGLAGPRGNVNFSKIKLLIVENKSTTAGDSLLVGNDGVISNPWTSGFSGTNARAVVGPNSPFVLPSPIDGLLVSGTNKSIAIKNTGSNTNALNGNILVIGEGT